MLNMSDLSKELSSNEISYMFQFKDTSPDSISLNQLDMLLGQN